MVRPLTSFGAALVLASSLCAGVVGAEAPQAAPPETVAADGALDARARAAFAAGLSALRAADWSLAEAHFRESLAVVARPSTRYNLAFVLFQQDRLAESRTVLEQLLSEESGADPTYREYAEALAVRIRERIDSQRPRAAPGIAPPVAQPPPARAARAPVIESTPAPPEEHSGPSAWGPWLSIGVGSGLIVAGGVASILAGSADGRVTRACPTLTHCDPALKDDRDEAIRFGRIADVLLVSGVTLVAGGVTWRLVVPTRPPRDRGRSEPVLVTVTARY